MDIEFGFWQIKNYCQLFAYGKHSKIDSCQLRIKYRLLNWTVKRSMHIWDLLVIGEYMMEDIYCSLPLLTKNVGEIPQICQLNVEEISMVKSWYLMKIFKENKIDLVLLQEIHQENEDQTGLRMLTILRTVKISIFW